MSYPDEICQLVIRNMEIVEEAPKVVELVQSKLFAAVNDRIKRRVAEQEDWKGVYNLDTDKEPDETLFCPSAWPENDADGYLAYYMLHYTEAGEEWYWLSSAIGLRGSALCLQFMVDKEHGDITTRENKKRLNAFYAATPVLHEVGFHVTKAGAIYRPFFFDAASLAEEYPDFDEALAPLDAALDSLFKAHAAFDTFVHAINK